VGKAARTRNRSVASNGQFAGLPLVVLGAFETVSKPDFAVILLLPSPVVERLQGVLKLLLAARF